MSYIGYGTRSAFLKRLSTHDFPCSNLSSKQHPYHAKRRHEAGADLLFCKIESSEVKIDNSFSLYVGPERDMALLEDMIDLKPPERVIMNPGTESDEIEERRIK